MCMVVCWKLVCSAQESITKVSDSFENILLKEIFGAYYMLDKHIGRTDKIMSFKKSDMINYTMVRKVALKLMFVCAVNSED